jgi:hypothetical protein
MVRRRSTVRFRKGAPGKPIFPDVDSIEQLAKASSGGAEFRPPGVSALRPDAVLAMTASWYFWVMAILPVREKVCWRQSGLTGVVASGAGRLAEEAGTPVPVPALVAFHWQ